jgi:hypothetical protein
MFLDGIIILGTAIATDVVWVKFINPALDRRKINEVFVRPKEACKVEFKSFLGKKDLRDIELG